METNLKFSFHPPTAFQGFIVTMVEGGKGGGGALWLGYEVLEE